MPHLPGVEELVFIGRNQTNLCHLLGTDEFTEFGFHLFKPVLLTDTLIVQHRVHCESP